MRAGLFSRFFSSPKTDKPADGAAPLTGEIGKTFQPSQGSFFRTLEYPQDNANGGPPGKIWMEAGRDEKTQSWVLWRKAIRTIDDPLKGGTANILTADPVFEQTDFVTAYDQMTTFEESQAALGRAPLGIKSAGRLGGDYYKQFAWREGLMMSRSGRLYPVTANTINAANYFDENDIKARDAFLTRMKAEQFVPVPIVLPAVDWAKVYERRKTATDERLRALYFRHGDDRTAFDLALQIVGNEAPEVLYAHLQQGFKPNSFAGEPEKHFALLKAAIDRSQVEVLHILTAAGISFYVRHRDETPLETVLQQHRYSHLHVMLSRDGDRLAQYHDESGNAAVATAIALKDRQAFRMLYLEGLDYGHTDPAGWAFVHHAFDNGFVPGIYAWLDEGLSIDAPVAGTGFTGLSIARRNNDQATIAFAIRRGANAAAPDFPPPVPGAAPVSAQETKPEPAQEQPAPAPLAPFSLDLLNTAATNAQIEAAATAYAAQGGTFDALDAGGLSVFELCRKNRKDDPALDRYALLPVFGRLGANPAARLADGTTVLTRITGAAVLDMDFLNALAPLVTDVNSPDAQGNDLLHVLQMNPNQAVSHSNNVAAVLALFPDLDLNRRNGDGLSNAGLAVRLDRGQTLKKIPPAVRNAADFGQVTAAGWSLLDIAFTAAAGAQPVTGAQHADGITAVSDKVRGMVLDIIETAGRTGSAAQKQSLSAAFARTRPDRRTLLEAAQAESLPAATAARLYAIQLTL